MAKKHYGEKKAMKKSAIAFTDDMSAPSCLPRYVVDQEFPSAYNGEMDRIDDLFTGVQRQMKQDGADMKRMMKPSKY